MNAIKLPPWLPARMLRLLLALTGATLLLALVNALMGGQIVLGKGLLVNVVLAAFPLLFALLLARRQHRGKSGVLRVILWALWLVMFPNAPYMFTDLIHVNLYDYTHGKEFVPAILPWLGLTHTVGCVVVGCMLGVLSMYVLHGIVRERHGNGWGRAYCGATCVLGGAGIYIGRFMRINSWDLWQRPAAVLARLAERLQLRTIALMLLFAAIIFGMYGLFYLCWHRPAEEKASGETA